MSITVQGQPVAASGITADEIELRRSFWHAALHFCRREPLGAIGMLIVIVMAVPARSPSCWHRTARPRTTSWR